MIKQRINIVVLSIYIACACLKGLTTSAIEVPDNLNPGVVGRDNIDSFEYSDYYEEELDDSASKNNLKVDKDLKTLKSGVDMEKESENNPEFLVNKIVVLGNTVINDEKLNKITHKFEGKKIKIDDLIKLCGQITTYYQSKGYITSRAKLLTQKIEGGVVEITIDEGKYGDISVNGNKWAKEKYLNNILSVNGINKDAVLNVNSLERSVSEINNKKYIRGNIIINNGKKSNLNDIALEVEDRLPIDLGVDINNYGTELTGMQRSLLKMSYDNVTGYGDSIYGGVILGNKNFGSVAGYSIPVWNKGASLNFGYSSYNVQYGGMYRNLGLRGNWQDYSIGLVQPIYRGGKWTIDSAINLDICDVKQSMDAIGDLSSQKLRVLRTGIYTKRTDNKGFWAIGTQVSTGLPILGATNASDNGGGADGKFVKLVVNLNRLQVLPKRSMLLFSLNGQYTPNELMSPEKVALGGMNLRGYETATLLGDVGFYGTIEVRTPVPFLRKVLPEKMKPYEDRVKMGYFYDFGVLRDVNGYGNLLTGKPINLMQTVGVGLHFPVGDLLTVNLDLGIPIGEKVLANQDLRLTFSLSSSFQNMWNWKKPDKTTL